MSDLDLRAATEAAGRVRYERVRRVKLDHGAFESAVPAWDDAAPQIRQGWIDGSAAEVAAAAPLIERQVREMVAREIDRSVTDDDAWHATCDDYHEAGWDGDPNDYEQMFWEAGHRRAARIARGGTP